MIDNQVYCQRCAKIVAEGMMRVAINNGFWDKASYYKSLLKEQISREEEQLKYEESKIDEEVDFEDGKKMRKLNKDPGGAMERPLRKVLHENLQRENLKRKEKKVQVPVGR